MNPQDYYGASELFAQSERVDGVKLIAPISYANAESYFAERQFDTLRKFDVPELTQAHLTRSDGSLVGKMVESYCSIVLKTT